MGRRVQARRQRGLLNGQLVFERHPTSLVTIEMQIKTTVTYHYKSIKTAKIDYVRKPIICMDI